MIQQMAHAQGVTEMLKAAGQMAWVGKMNNLRAGAMEIMEQGVGDSLRFLLGGGAERVVIHEPTGSLPTLGISLL